MSLKYNAAITEADLSVHLNYLYDLDVDSDSFLYLLGMLHDLRVVRVVEWEGYD
jgi:hypothetical protein